MHWLWYAAALLAVLIFSVFLTGTLLPREHVAERTQSVNASPEVVYDRIADFANRPQWVTGLREVNIEPGGRFYTEVHGMGPLRMEVMELTRPLKLVTRIADETLEFGGTWTITIASASAGSRVTVREDGFVKSALFRFVSRFVMGHTRTIDQFLKDLSAQYPQSVS